MATLQSPGVQVTVINESFYTPAAPGTVPLLFVASASDKSNPSGVTAPGTTAANSGKVYLITSQRDLVDTFGTPLFYTDAQGNPIHGGELNEYGLQAAYSLLGVSSAAYVVRAPIDLASLIAKSSAPAGNPANGSYWVNTADSLFGIFEWNNTTGTFTNKTPFVIDDSNAGEFYDSVVMAPKATYGTVGQYALVFMSDESEATVFYKNSENTWTKVGSQNETNFTTNSAQNTFASTTWGTSWPVVTGTAAPTAITCTATNSITINGNAVFTVANNGDGIGILAQNINGTLKTSGIGAKRNTKTGRLELYVDAKTTATVTVGGTTSVLAQAGLTAGTYNAPTVFIGPHTQYPNFASQPTGSIYLKTTAPNSGANWVVKQWSATSNAWNTVKAPIYASPANATYFLDKTGGGANIPVGTVFVESNYTHGNGTAGKPILGDFKVWRRDAVSPTTISNTPPTSAVSFTTATLSISITQPGTNGYALTETLTIGRNSADLIGSIAYAINGAAANLPGLSASSNDNSLSITHATGGEIRFNDNAGLLARAGFTTNTTSTTANFFALSGVEADGYDFIATNWKPMTFTASDVAPSATPANGQLWYSSIIDQVDILIHDGSKWRGYRSVYPNTDKNGPIVSATRPTKQSDGVTALANGDIWISTSSIDRYGKDIYVYSGSSLSWVLQDVTDQTSPDGWLFADARWSGAGDDVSPDSTQKLLTYDYVDPDAPDPAEYPRGMRLWNTRRSGFNIKKFVKGYINKNANDGKNLRYNNESMDNYTADRWVSVSPNNADGSGTFGRFAQRAFVTTALKSVVDSNQSIRDTDTLTFNLIATPGYPELIQNMISLNVDRGLTAFVIGDTSMRLKPTGTDLAAYGLNSNGAFDNGENGLVSYNEYMAVFYPSGYTNDLAGNYIVVPPSHMMLRTIAVSDQKSYPWFAPAGIRRGVVDNATSVGYLEDGEFKATALPTSIRDVMATKGKINPIATITGAGIINFGQYTRANAASALDRINVARLVAYLRRQLDVLARPFLFEPNDKITRNEIKNSVQKLLLELVGQRALYDFIVVCDESNNTPARIDRSELWVDVAIEPVKAVEFIYIPVRLVNTGAIKAGNFTLA
jgi:hypothetical protein